MIEPYSTVYYRYLQEAMRVDGPQKQILKLDAFNEAENWPPPGGIATRLEGDVTLLELDIDVMTKAGTLHPELNIWQGDIRDMPFANQFDVLLDLSTIDHIPPEDVATALDEYKRVTHPGSDLVIVSWTGKEDAGLAPIQVYHDLRKLTQALGERFTLTYREVLLSWPPWELILWRCKA